MAYGSFSKRVSPNGSWLVSGAPTTDVGQWWFKGTIRRPDGTAMDLTFFRGRLTVGLPLLRSNPHILPRDLPTDGSPTLQLDFTARNFASFDKWLFTKEVTITNAAGGVFEVTVFASDIPAAVSPVAQAQFDFLSQQASTWDAELAVPNTLDAQGLPYLLPYSVALWNVHGTPSIKLYPLYGILQVDPSIIVTSGTVSSNSPYNVIPTS